MGEDLQWGKVCNGFSAPLQIFRGEGLQWGKGLQYNTGMHFILVFYLNFEKDKGFSHINFYMYMVNIKMCCRANQILYHQISSLIC